MSVIGVLTAGGDCPGLNAVITTVDDDFLCSLNGQWRAG